MLGYVYELDFNVYLIEYVLAKWPDDIVGAFIECRSKFDYSAELSALLPIDWSLLGNW